MPLEGKRILDIGCGAGILSLALCRLGAEVVGLDATGNVIEIAKSARETLQPQLRSNANFVQGTVEEFVLEPENIGAFDGVVASEVVEHVRDVPSFVQHCCKLTKPNSPLFFTTINRTIWSQIFAIFVAEDLLRLLPKGLHDYNKFVTPEELRKLLFDMQCRVGPTLGLLYNPLLNRWNWSNFSELNYALVGVTPKH